MKGEADGLKEAKAEVRSNDLTLLNSKIDKLEQENRDLQSKLPSSTSQITAPNGGFNIVWDEPIADRQLSVAFSNPVFWMFVIKTLLYIHTWLVYLGVDTLWYAKYALVGAQAIRYLEFIPFCLIFWNAYLCLSSIRGKTNWRLYYFLFRKPAVFCFFFFFFDFIRAYHSVTVQWTLGGVPSKVEVSSDLRWIGPIYDICLVLILLFCRRLISTDFTTFSVKHVKRHTYKILPSATGPGHNADLRTEVSKRGKLVFTDPKHATALYSHAKVSIYTLDGEDVETGDPVSERW